VIYDTQDPIRNCQEGKLGVFSYWTPGAIVLP
jgi:hypothetical protein